MDKGWGLFRIGLRRRKKEVRRMKVMMCLAVFFIAFMLLFQDNMNSYQMELNYRSFGSWLVCEENKQDISHSELYMQGTILRGSTIFLPDKDAGPEEELTVSYLDNGLATSYSVGTMTADFAKENRISLYEGRFPEKSGEIVMELGLLEKLSLSYELGQEVTFLLAKCEDTAVLREQALEKKLAEQAENGQEPQPGSPSPQPIPGADPSGEQAEEPRVTAGDFELSLYPVRFTLVGTIDRYSARWNATDLPSAILYPEEYPDLEMTCSTYTFYTFHEDGKEAVWEKGLRLLQEVAGGVNQQAQAAAASPEEYTGVSQHTFYNQSAFSNPFWGNAAMYRGMTVILILLGTAIVAYLMASYLNKRRPFFLRMRSIGASTAEVWKMASYECVLSTLPATLVTLLSAYGFSLIAVLAVSLISGIRFFYVFSLKTLGVILLSILLTLGLSLLVALLLFAGRGIAIRQKALQKGPRKALLRRFIRKTGRKRPYLGFKETLIRRRRTSRLSHLFVQLIGLAVCLVLFTCLSLIGEKTESYRTTLRTIKQFSGNVMDSVSHKYEVPVKGGKAKPGEKPTKQNMQEISSGTRESYTLTKTIPAELIKEIRTLPGVDTLTTASLDETRRIEWDGKNEDAFYLFYLETAVDSTVMNVKKVDRESRNMGQLKKELEKTFYLIQTLDDPSEYWDAYQAYLDPAVADREAFLRGEQVILIVDQRLSKYRYYLTEAALEDKDISWNERLNLMNENRFNYWEDLGSEIGTGTQLRIVTDNEPVSVTVAGIVPYGEAGLQNVQSLPVDGATCMLRLIGAETILDKVRAEEGRTLGCNYFRIRFNAMADRENTLAALATLCVRNGITYSSGMEKIREAKDAMVQAILLYGFVSAVLLILYLFVRSAIAEEERFRLAGSCAALKRSGLSDRQMKKDKRRDALVQALPLLFSVPLYLLIKMIARYQSLSLERSLLSVGEDHGKYSRTAQHIYSIREDPLTLQAFFFTLDDIAWLLLLIPVLVMIIAVWKTDSRIPDTRTLERNYKYE
jgi:hypothetical protein